MDLHHGNHPASQRTALRVAGGAMIEQRGSSPLDQDSTAAILRVSSPVEFTADYDEAVDETEAELISEAVSALQTWDVDRAGTSLARVLQLRGQYLTLLDIVAREPTHPLHDAADELREFAVANQRLAQYLSAVVDAVRAYRSGRAKEALSLLDGLPTASRSAIEGLDSLLASQATMASENMAALIRRGTLDYAGARAAYDRVNALAELALEDLSSAADEAPEGAFDAAAAGLRFQQLVARASSKHMQHLLFTAGHDLASASESARAAASAYAEAGEMASEILPMWGPLFQATAHEAEALALSADAELALGDGAWDLAADRADEVRTAFDLASRSCLRSGMPYATQLQERYLNASFAWSTTFRQRLERERAHATRLEELQTELKELYASVQKALGPAGVVVNNANELANSVHQQVEITNRIEHQIRGVLRDAPQALESLPVAESERQALIEEARALADASDSGPGFLEKAGAFARKLAGVTKDVAGLAPPVLALLKVLSIVA